MGQSPLKRAQNLNQQALACFVFADTDLGSVAELPICRPADLTKLLGCHCPVGWIVACFFAERGFSPSAL